MLRSPTTAVVLALAATALFGFASLTDAAQYVAVGERPTILYDAPSQRAERQFVVSRQYPLEVLVRLEQWTKVRDMAGDVGWIENKALGNRRFVAVTADSAEVRSAALDTAGVVFSAQKHVLLELLDVAATPVAATGAAQATPPPLSTIPVGWARVAHRDGQSGFIRVSQIWGAQ